MTATAPVAPDPLARAGTVATLVLLALAAALAAVAWDATSEARRTADDLTYVGRLGEQVRYLDEVLTESARMYATTGNAWWLHRYERAEPLLGEALDLMAGLAPSHSYLDAVAATDSANDRLVAIEQESLGLTRSGHPAEALALLLGAEYTAQKQVYQEGNDRALATLRQDLGRREAAASETAGWAGLALLADVVVLAALASVLLVRVQRETRRRQAMEAEAILAEQRSKMEQLERLARMKNAFLNHAAHELATPLTPIKLQLASLRTFLGNGLDPRHKEAVLLLDRNFERLAGLVRDLLDAARLQSGQLKVTVAPVDVRRLAEEVVASFRGQAAGQGLGLHVDGADSVVVETDGARLTQVLFNLVSNACKFTPAGGQVALSVGVQDDGGARIEVRDTGPGLSKDQMDRLFQPFSQVHEDTTKVLGGAGLGLYISRSVVEGLGGSLEVRSPGSGLGCTFTVAVPRRAPDGAGRPGALHAALAAAPASRSF